MKNKEGRPLLFKTPEELQIKIDEYFKKCKNNMKKVLTKTGDIIEVQEPLIPTIAGLAYALGIDRQTVYNYEDKDEFFGTIKKARDFILSELENGLINYDNPTGKIFIAKNYGYKDKSDIEHTGKVDLSEIKQMFIDNLKND